MGKKKTAAASTPKKSAARGIDAGLAHTIVATKSSLARAKEEHQALTAKEHRSADDNQMIETLENQIQKQTDWLKKNDKAA